MSWLQCDKPMLDGLELYCIVWSSVEMVFLKFFFLAVNQINQSARVFQDDINPELLKASLEMPWFVLRQWLIVDLTYSTQCVRTKSHYFIRYTCPITCCMCVKRPLISPSIIVWFITTFIHPGVMASLITCNFTLCSTAFHIINKQPIYFWLNIHLMGKLTVRSPQKGSVMHVILWYHMFLIIYWLVVVEC